MPPAFLHYGRQSIDEDDIAAVTAVLRGDWLTTGPAIARFEEAFARAVGARFAVSCANGTAALHLAALAQGLGPGDWAIVPAITFLATANALRYVGADVIFADVDPGNGLATAQTLAAAADRAPPEARGKIKAILPVHLAGQVCDMDAIRTLAHARGWAVIEDACHALGGAYGDGTSIGGARGQAIFSFHPVKTITSAEGGMITSDDAVLAERLARLRSHGIVRDAARFENSALATAANGAANPWYYEMPEPGFNYRLTDVQAALGWSQLAKLRRFVERRAEIVARYDRRLAPLAPAVTPIKRNGIGRPARHLYPVLVDFPALGLDRAAAMARLRAAGVGSQVHYVPLHLQPYYRRRYGERTLPGAEAYYRRTLSLPLYPAMIDSDVDRVADALAALARGDAHGR